MPDDELKTEGEAPNSKSKRRWAKRLGWAIAIVLFPLVLFAAFFSSPIGKRFVTDQIAQVAPASGLRFEVGRIEGDIYGEAVLHDVTLKDPKGAFLTIPELELDWRPLSWLWSGIDIRELAVRRARLERLPELLPGDPDAPILPDFDIRLDQFEIDSLTLAPGLAGERAQRVDFNARIDIRSGRSLIDADGAFGQQDRIDLLLDAEPDGDRFDLALDYQAAADGPIAALLGFDAAYDARIAGEGTWTKWLGHALVTRETSGAQDRVASFRLTNVGGQYGALGQVSAGLDQRTILGRSMGDVVSLALSGTLENSVFDGRIAAVSSALDLRGDGALDLASNRADRFELGVLLRDPDLFGQSARLVNARLSASLEGPFRDLAIDHRLTMDQLNIASTVNLSRVRQAGEATFNGEALLVPMDIESGEVTTGLDWLDPHLSRGRLEGLLSFDGTNLDADTARLTFPELRAELTLRGDTTSNVYAVAGPVRARNLGVAELGNLNAEAKLLAKFGSNVPWSVRANLAGLLDDVANSTFANLGGEQVRFSGSAAFARSSPVVLRDVVLESERLNLRLDSRTLGDQTSLAGTGEHVQYGAFDFDAELASDGPRAQFLLSDPYPDAGLADVRLGIAPEDDGFAVDVSGASLLGPFEGALGIELPADAPAQIAVKRLRVYRTNVLGALALNEGGVAGNLELSGGGIDGAILLTPGNGGAQGFELDLSARGAQFAGETNIGLGFADIFAAGAFDASSSRIEADIEGTDFEFGALRIAAFNAKGTIEDGAGSMQASIAGRRADRFALKLDGDFSPKRIAVIAQGEYGGRSISMPRRAVLTSLDEGGYRLEPTQIGFANGYTILEGVMSPKAVEFEASMARMPLQLADLAGSELGLGGRVNGVLTWSQQQAVPPTGSARVRIDNFTRSGLVLSSRPVDVFAVANLSSNELAVGARLLDGDERLGRLDARVTGLGPGGDLGRRIMRGSLDAGLSYEGPAQSLWRLLGLETFDLTGPLALNAKAGGTLEDPRITGAIASDRLRLQSAISGTDVTDIAARGRFAGSKLELTRFEGRTRGDGAISGSGSVDLAGLSAGKGPQIDIRLAANQAQLLNASGLNATITGPLRIVSNGSGGAIAGRVQVNRASWSLGVAGEDMRLPTIPTTEVNAPSGQRAERRTVTGAWRYLIDAEAPNRIAVEGLGLNSEWGIDIALRGTVDDPRIGGEASLVRGDYTFAGTRFDLTDGRIDFDEEGPIDPRLDINAATSANGTAVGIAITGNAMAPQIAFSSSPALPDEEILARLLFGGSVTSLSATDAVQLGAALAALQGGGAGLDPIGTLRRSVGLDQLRIVSADPALGRGTGVALGKNLGRRVYVELVTDGQGYSASQVEYRITNWLALLGTVTTIGRDSVLAEVSRDY